MKIKQTIEGMRKKLEELDSKHPYSPANRSIDAHLYRMGIARLIFTRFGDYRLTKGESENEEREKD